MDEGHDSVVSLSIEETNKLRAKLGLAPLEIPQPQSSKELENGSRKRRREFEESQPQPTADEVRERIDRARAQRRIAEMMKLPDMDDEDDDLDVAAWTEKMRRQEKAKEQPRREQPSWQSGAMEGATEMSMKLGHGLRLKEGESVILTLADRHVLDASDAGEDAELVIEDARLKELERYKKNVKERKRIKEYLASAGPTGISGRVIDHDSDDSEEEGALGPLMPPDEAEGHQSLMTDEDYTALADKYALTSQSGVTAPTIIKSVVVRTTEGSADNAETQDQAATATKSRPLLVDKQAKLKAKREKLKRKKAIDWADVFGQDEETIKNELTDERDIKPGDVKPNTEATVTVKSWGVVANDLEDDGEDEENTQFYGAIFNRMKTAPVEDVQVKDEETLKTLELLPKVKEELNEGHAMNDGDDHEAGIRTSIGVIDEGTVTVKPEMIITSTEEFAKSLQTPLEKLEERKSFPLAKKRGTEVETRKRTRAETDGKPITFQDIPEEILMEKAAILDEERIDSGLSSALQYIKRKGDLEEDKWKLGRVGKEQKKPLHKSIDADDVKLDYTDDYGNVMNPKQAFRYMSWSFHGKGPGKTKTEKMLKRMEVEHKLKTDDPSKVMPTLRALRAQQAKGEAYLVLSSGGQQAQKR